MCDGSTAHISSVTGRRIRSCGTFVIELTTADKIKKARAIVDDEETTTIHVRGEVVKEARFYNKPWRSWHLAPTSTDFFAYAAEVCDASVVLLEKRLQDVGGGFLPNNVWCHNIW
jgi:hypothetical protein